MKKIISLAALALVITVAVYAAQTTNAPPTLPLPLAGTSATATNPASGTIAASSIIARDQVLFNSTSNGIAFEVISSASTGDGSPVTLFEAINIKQVTNAFLVRGNGEVVVGGKLALRTNTAPSNPSNIVAWVTITNLAGGTFKMPLYQ